MSTTRDSTARLKPLNQRVAVSMRGLLLAVCGCQSSVSRQQVGNDTAPSNQATLATVRANTQVNSSGSASTSVVTSTLPNETEIASSATNATGTGSCKPSDVWGPNRTFAVSSVADFGAKPNDNTDDTDAFIQAAASLSKSGGLLMFPPGTYNKVRRLWINETSHTLLWSPSGKATIHAHVSPRPPKNPQDPDPCGARDQATIFRRTTGGGIHGLKFSSDAVERFTCAESSEIFLDGVDDFELVATEIAGASSAGVFTWSSDPSVYSERLRFVGNYVHHTYADSMHFTGGTRGVWAWDNDFFNEPPTMGDDGIACVTYNLKDPRCGEMEWWHNTYFGGGHGRGFAVVGGEDISIHDNWVIGSPAAGLLVASEPSFGTPGSSRIQMTHNYLVRSPNGSVSNGHSAILISGLNTRAKPLNDITVKDNVVIGPADDKVERAEGQVERVDFANNNEHALPLPPEPKRALAGPRSSAILKTWDQSFVAEDKRNGLYRIHAREASDKIEVRFEYVVKGSVPQLYKWVNETTRGCRATSVAQKEVGNELFAVLHSNAPISVPSSFSGVAFGELRAGDRNGTLSWLWATLDQ